ncbi:MAG TPA: phage capsid protein, partial [Verrucomicrobiae bacterium]|nr:phage capsid protein [Verrucomicrobiae bacterium]
TLDGSGNDNVLFWTKSGIKLGIGKDATARISERDDKNYATQVFYSMIIGATRMEEAKVGIITCSTTTGPGI